MDSLPKEDLNSTVSLSLWRNISNKVCISKDSILDSSIKGYILVAVAAKAQNLADCQDWARVARIHRQSGTAFVFYG